MTPFKKKFFGVVVVCVVISVVCIIGLLLSGPRIRQVDYDPVAVTKDLNQTIILRSNQPLKPVDISQIHLEPTVDFNVVTSGDAIIIQLKQRLLYGTDYTIRIDQLGGQSGRKINSTSKLKTASTGYYYLKRNYETSSSTSMSYFPNKKEDEIISGSINGKDESVYSSYKIQDFILVGANIIILQADEDDQQKLVLYDPQTKETKEIPLPEENGSVYKLTASSDPRFFGFTFSSNVKSNDRPYESNLFIYDMEAKLLDEVKGIGDAKMSVTNWLFMPDGSSLVAETYSTGTLFVDVFSLKEPIPLGSINGVVNSSSDGSKVMFMDYSNGATILNTSDKKRTPYTTQAIDGVVPIINKVRLLQNSDGVIKLLNIPGRYSYSNYTYVLVMDRGGEEKALFGVESNQADIRDYIPTNNDQYLAVEIGSMSGREYDKYGSYAQPTNVETMLVDTISRKEIKTIEGSKLVWE